MYDIRNLQIDDYDKSYVNLLNQLSKIDNMNKITFANLYPNLPKNIIVIENLDTNLIVASGTLLLEQKIIHNGSKIGHIEDIVIDVHHRGYGLGKLLMKRLLNVAKKENCYKVILNCTDPLIKFYQKFDFYVKDNSMSIYF